MICSLFGLDLSTSLRGLFSFELTLGDIKDLDIELEPQISQESNFPLFNLSYASELLNQLSNWCRFLH